MLASGKLCGGYWREERRRYRELTPYSWEYSANASKLTARRGRRQDAPISYFVLRSAYLSPAPSVSPRLLFRPSPYRFGKN